MHLLQIVHLDIKPSNIMFSNSLNKFLLIDFGLSKFVQQKIGFKTFTQFVGTPSYCSKQMIKCLKEKGYVDLYLNDVESLINSIEAFKNVKTLRQFSAAQNKKIDKKISNYFSFLTFSKISVLKFCFFWSLFSKAKKIFL